MIMELFAGKRQDQPRVINSTSGGCDAVPPPSRSSDDPCLAVLVVAGLLGRGRRLRRDSVRPRGHLLPEERHHELGAEPVPRGPLRTPRQPGQGVRAGLLTRRQLHRHRVRPQRHLPWLPPGRHAQSRRLPQRRALLLQPDLRFGNRKRHDRRLPELPLRRTRVQQHCLPIAHHGFVGPPFPGNTFQLDGRL